MSENYSVTLVWPTLAVNGITQIKYPAGELQIRLTESVLPEIRRASTVAIQARICSSDELIGILLLADAIRAANADAEQVLQVPYLPYARADRRFTDGDCHGLKVFGNLLHSAGFDRIQTLDVHNPVKFWRYVGTLNTVNYSSAVFLQRAYKEFKDLNRTSLCAVLAGDASAGKRLDCAHATKVRDTKTGELSGFSVPANTGSMPTLIVDDICDGGGTFIGIAREIRKEHPKAVLGLYVTHGLFSKGLSALHEYFSHIYTTDSFRSRWLHTQTGLVGGVTVYDAFEVFT